MISSTLLHILHYIINLLLLHLFIIVTYLEDEGKSGCRRTVTTLAFVFSALWSSSAVGEGAEALVGEAGAGPVVPGVVGESAVTRWSLKQNGEAESYYLCKWVCYKRHILNIIIRLSECSFRSCNYQIDLNIMISLITGGTHTLPIPLMFCHYPMVRVGPCSAITHKRPGTFHTFSLIIPSPISPSSSQWVWLPQVHCYSLPSCSPSHTCHLSLIQNASTSLLLYVLQVSLLSSTISYWISSQKSSSFYQDNFYLFSKFLTNSFSFHQQLFSAIPWSVFFISSNTSVAFILYLFFFFRCLFNLVCPPCTPF